MNLSFINDSEKIWADRAFREYKIPYKIFYDKRNKLTPGSKYFQIKTIYDD